MMLGVGRVVGTDLLEPEVRWELYEGGSGGDEYPDLDRWMRTEGWGPQSQCGAIGDPCQWERYGKTGADRYVYNESVTYDSAGNITSREDNIHTAGATGSGNGLFDVQYTLDGLHRLTTADEGNWTGSAINNRTRDEIWTLDQLGNADLAKRDLDGDQNYNETNEFNDNRGFNDVNELRTRDADNSSGTTTDNYEPDYDKAGNLIDDDKRTPTGTYTYRYTYDYDGWNRLVAVRKQNGDLVAEYTYNGEGHRVSWKYDTDADNDVDANDQTFYFGYDENWRPVVTARGSDGNMKEQFVYHAAGNDGYGSSSYIDHVFRGYRDLTNGWAGSADGVLETVTDRCHGWRPDIVVVLNAASGAVHEWAKYLSYGEPFGLAIGDANSTGTSTIGDAATIQGWAAAGPPATYDARGDMNGDNQIDGSDLSAWAVYAGGLSVLSHVGNRAGYAGYQHDPSLSDAFYHVRHRVLDSGLGRWMQRDPLLRASWPNSYEYAGESVLSQSDPFGLVSTCIGVDTCAQSPPTFPTTPRPCYFPGHGASFGCAAWAKCYAAQTFTAGGASNAACRAAAEAAGQQCCLSGWCWHEGFFHGYIAPCTEDECKQKMHDAYQLCMIGPPATPIPPPTCTSNCIACAMTVGGATGVALLTACTGGAAGAAICGCEALTVVGGIVGTGQPLPQYCIDCFTCLILLNCD